MEYPREQAPLDLLLFTAKKLREQYAGRPEEKEFDQKIAAVEAINEPADELHLEHDAGKLPPLGEL